MWRAVHFQMIVDAPVTEECPDGFTVVPDSEVIVARTAYRDNSSEYRYNGKKMSFKDVAVELRRLVIDLDHNRCLILQGEVQLRKSELSIGNWPNSEDDPLENGSFSSQSNTSCK
jgi:hypothetical protein